MSIGCEPRRSRPPPIRKRLVRALTVEANMSQFPRSVYLVTVAMIRAKSDGGDR
jgi:hypothetical protein